ncbi:lipopolysaccharide heptosyltransferase I [Aquabacterium sp. OR-4]|uniref:lipopolysaccharide heptosyltransferase I n=1 Tax=Aquabacterium sp. OR-4 TaxID=2978127 RepID=UPI0021B34766|nr:lipopolysaccharide heptosyltransferase I [Aquabacterium sp. OR-4]MDT7836839.1 lipopolysaccharide heptosyltransferase I [Aquabacterium sp. OR-4]
MNLSSGRVLIVKTTSMGDVVHALPAISDIRHYRPGIGIDWLVEAPFAAIPALHPAVRRVIPIAWRKWRKSLLAAPTRAAIAQARADLRRDEYDLVIDLQGLLKSVLWGAQARGPLAGFDRDSIREPLAALAYRRMVRVSREAHAVARCRALVSGLLGYQLPEQWPEARPDFGIVAPAFAAGDWQPPALAAALIPCASRPEKLWPEAHWIALGQRLRRARLTPVVVWGSDEERQRAERIAAACEGIVPPFLSVAQMAAVLSRARQIVGLDTGFSHLAAAFGAPTIGIYCDHEPGLAGITGPGPVASFGGKGQVPSLDEVMAQLDKHLGPR